MIIAEKKPVPIYEAECHECHSKMLMDRILTAQEQMLKHNIEANSVTLNGRKYGKLIENLPPNMKPTIFGMAVKADYALPDDYDFLVQYEPPQPQTNADNIRQMTDEELTDFLLSHSFCWKKWEEEVECQGACGCDECISNWLKQEGE